MVVQAGAYVVGKDLSSLELRVAVLRSAGIDAEIGAVEQALDDIPRLVPRVVVISFDVGQEHREAIRACLNGTLLVELLSFTAPGDLIDLVTEHL